MTNLKDAVPPRGCCRYQPGKYSEETLHAFPHFPNQTVRWIDITEQDFDSPDVEQNGRNQMAVFLFSEIIGRIINDKIPTLHPLLSSVEPNTELQYGTLLEKGLHAIQTGRIVIRTASQSCLSNDKLDKTFTWGGVYPIRIRTTDHQGLYALEGETIGVVVNDKHPFVDPKNQGRRLPIPDTIIDEIPLAIANAQVQLEINKGHLDQFLTQPQIDTGIFWLLTCAGLPTPR